MLMGVMAPIAVSDTIFSVVRGVLTFPFVKPFVRLIEWMVPQPEDEKPHLSAIKAGLRVSPVIACDQALMEVDFMKASDLEALQKRSSEIHAFVRECRRQQLGRVGPEDPGSSIRVLGELDIINAYERIRAYYLNCAETLAGGKR